ncbi:exocyst complex component EXO84A-like isoform X2 [Andrographis paniculata]|uniref:exocyst complex component EXO84A-like isoform X2 n=1 Tax=Andrographis paniculata TaxID=175694 RepID=UPI0021E92675|nr:exocyst complex component EXO84A-like isoform X2 [Andrographis paniculata]
MESVSRFRFRNHSEEIGDDDSAERHTSADSSSITSEEDPDLEFQSMTAKGVQHLCSELLELKRESDEDFQKIISSNYTAFLAIVKEIDCLKNEALRLKNLASSQRRIVEDIRDGISSCFLSEQNLNSVPEEPSHDQPSSPTVLEKHTESVSEILDNLLREQRLDDAITLLDMEAEFVQTLQSGGSLSSDQLMSYNSTMLEKKSILSDRLVSMAKHPRISAPELQKVLIGLCQLGDNRLATQLMLRYYRIRTASLISDLSSSKELPHAHYIREVARFVCSTISQAATSFVALNGETRSYTSELTQWAFEEIDMVADCFGKHVNAVPEISGRLSAAVDATKIVTSYCSLLEAQRIFLQPHLIEQIYPCIEEVLQLHIDHLSRVVSIFTSSESWILGRYYVSGILTGQSCVIVDQQPEFFFLTNSGRKFATLFQSVVEELSPLIGFQMESLVLKGIVDLFVSYVDIHESALTGKTDAADRGSPRIGLSEFPIQGVSVLANMSTLAQFFSGIVRNVFNGVDHLDSEINNHIILTQNIYSRLKASFLDQFIANIFSSDPANESASETDMIPSVPYLKLQKLTEDDSIDSSWLMSLLVEAMSEAFRWISTKSAVWRISEENLANHSAELMQFTLDVQFLLEVSRRDGYLSDGVVNIAGDIMARIETAFLSAGQNPLRDLEESEWPADAASLALDKLQELREKELLEDENAREDENVYGVDIPLNDRDEPAIGEASATAIDGN